MCRAQRSGELEGELTRMFNDGEYLDLRKGLAAPLVAKEVSISASGLSKGGIKIFNIGSYGVFGM